MQRRKVILMGAAGRDFHNFNMLYRDNQAYEVVAFTAAQIPDIDGRQYPAELAGELYPHGIPVHSENELPELIAKNAIHDVVFSYSDVPYTYVMRQSAMVNALGATFSLPGAHATMLNSQKPVVAVCAVRTGAGKSQTTRRVAEVLKQAGKKIAVVRHPMPYGDLTVQVVQRFETHADLDRYHCTIEEREEYEPHLDAGSLVFAGVDYARILAQAETEADVILWDGGNNDTAFFRPDLYIVVVDPLRPGHEINYYPGEVNLRLADAVIINKQTSAASEDINIVRENVKSVNQDAVIVDAASPISVENADIIAGKRILAIEDGPTLTHGEMKFGAAVVAARRFGAAEIIDPRPFLVGTLRETFARYPGIGNLLPAMGYGNQQITDLQATIDAADCDAVVIGTPIDLRRIIDIKKPATRVGYALQELGKPDITDIIDSFLNKTA